MPNFIAPACDGGDDAFNLLRMGSGSGFFFDRGGFALRDCQFLFLLQPPFCQRLEEVNIPFVGRHAPLRLDGGVIEIDASRLDPAWRAA